MKYFIVTGASSGLGEALSVHIIKQQHTLFCISRQENVKLQQIAKASQSALYYFNQDLTDTLKIRPLIEEIFNHIDTRTATEITLFNNAGVVQPVGPLGQLDVEDIINHININLLAPIALTNEFIKLSRELNIKKNIINISSGAANNPYYGWTLYCSSKAGINMLTKAVGIEQASLDYPVTILSIAPGVIDTPMQKSIRETNILDFPMRPRFDNLHINKLLEDPYDVAGKMLEVIDQMHIKTGEIIDLRNLSY